MTSAKVLNRSLLAADFKTGEIPAKGPKGRDRRHRTCRRRGPQPARRASARCRPCPARVEGGTGSHSDTATCPTGKKAISGGYNTARRGLGQQPEHPRSERSRTTATTLSRSTARSDPLRLRQLEHHRARALRNRRDLTPTAEVEAGLRARLPPALLPSIVAGSVRRTPAAGRCSRKVVNDASHAQPAAEPGDGSGSALALHHARRRLLPQPRHSRGTSVGTIQLKSNAVVSPAKVLNHSPCSPRRLQERADPEGAQGRPTRRHRTCRRRGRGGRSGRERCRAGVGHRAERAATTRRQPRARRARRQLSGGYTSGISGTPTITITSSTRSRTAASRTRWTAASSPSAGAGT